MSVLPRDPSTHLAHSLVSCSTAAVRRPSPSSDSTCRKVQRSRLRRMAVDGRSKGRLTGFSKAAGGWTLKVWSGAFATEGTDVYSRWVEKGGQVPVLQPRCCKRRCNGGTAPRRHKPRPALAPPALSGCVSSSKSTGAGSGRRAWPSSAIAKPGREQPRACTQRCAQRWGDSGGAGGGEGGLGAACVPSAPAVAAAGPMALGGLDPRGEQQNARTASSQLGADRPTLARSVG